MFERVELKQLTPRVFLMDDNHEATGYLICGDERVLVVDTMNGYADIKAIAATVTDKPVTVINTHGHPDHILGNVWFSRALIAKEDLPIVEHLVREPRFQEACRQYGFSMPPFDTVKEGDVIDLGGAHCEVIALPGHTPGGICVLYREERILFTGDSINRHLWMQLDESLSLAETLKNLERIAWVKEKADHILHGHAQGFESITLYDEMTNGIRELVNQHGTEATDKDEEYSWFGGKALQHRFAENSVIVYTKDKLPCADGK